MIEDYPNYYSKKIWAYMRSLWGRKIARVWVLRFRSILPSPSVTTRSTSFLILLMAEISRAIVVYFRKVDDIVVSLRRYFRGGSWPGVKLLSKVFRIYSFKIDFYLRFCCTPIEWFLWRSLAANWQAFQHLFQLSSWLLLLFSSVFPPSLISSM